MGVYCIFVLKIIKLTMDRDILGFNAVSLKGSKLQDFNTHISNLRWVMEKIGKNNITLNTSEPIGVGHSYGLDKKYSLNIGQSNITFLNNSNQTIAVTDAYINSCKWFQVYIYVVEIELEIKKINNHVQDSVAVSEMLALNK